jgi:hypothetical protein
MVAKQSMHKALAMRKDKFDLGPVDGMKFEDNLP